MKHCFSIIFLIFIYTSVLSQNSWEKINSDIFEDLHDIEFIDNTTGYIYAYKTGKIYKTTDEGLKWEIISTTDSVNFEQIQFINSKTGWICGEKGKLLKTIDAGKTWNDLSFKDNNLSFYGMCFINDSVGYLSGTGLKEKKRNPVIYRTANGGVSWTMVLENITPSIYNLYKKGNDLFGTGNGSIVKINLLNNSWKYVFNDTLGIVGQIKEIKFSNDRFGMAVSLNGNLLISYNGGETFSWKKISLNRLRSIVYLGDRKWMAVGDNNMNDGAVFYSSADNGDTWQKSNNFPDIHRITCTEKSIWIVGKNGFIAKMKR